MEIVVHTYLSPRIVEILPPTTDVTVQEIVNALRDWEDDNLSFDPLIDAAGKENLGGGVQVGITATLLNCQLMFTARSAPLEVGTCTQDDTTGQRLIASGGTFITSGVYEGCTAYNETSGAMAGVNTVVSETELRHFKLGGGSRDTWLNGDTYKIYPNVQCSITGGNLVAVDENGVDISPVIQTPNVQVIRTSSSSATLMELSAIQFASFNGGVTVDITSPYSGTSFPVGTPQEPVNNLSDAMQIAADRGFTTFYIVDNITIDNGGDYSEKTFVGESMSKTTITINADANVAKCEFYEATITGTLDGDAKVKNCRIIDLNYIHGVVEQCMLGPGIIVLGGDNEAHFLDCWSGAIGDMPPIIDCGGSGQELALRNYNGEIKIINKTGPEDVAIDLNAGHVVLDSTVTNGNIDIHGLGIVEDNSTGTTIVDTSALINTNQISQAVWDEQVTSHVISGSSGETVRLGAFDGYIWIDTHNGVSGSAYPTGTPFRPVDNLDDAIVIAQAVGIRSFMVRGTVTLNSNIGRWVFRGNGDLENNIILLNGQNIENCYFELMTLTGTCSGIGNYNKCVLYNVDGLSGIGIDCGLQGTIKLGASGTSLLLKDCSAISDPTVIDMTGDNRAFQAQGTGDFKLINASADCLVSFSISNGSVEIDSSCVGGSAIVQGIATVIDNSNGMTVADQTLAGLHGGGSWEGAGAAGDIADAVWDEPRSEHTQAGSFGAVGEWSGQGMNPDDIASAVWDAIATSYGSPGTMGWLQNLIDNGIIKVPQVIPGE